MTYEYKWILHLLILAVQVKVPRDAPGRGNAVFKLDFLTALLQTALEEKDERRDYIQLYHTSSLTTASTRYSNTVFKSAADL